jgi:hypothetical protein
MKPRINVRQATHIAAAGIVAACWIQPALAGQDASGADAVARENWRAAMAHNPDSGAGCFHAAYPSYVWEKVECKTAHPLVHPVHDTSAGVGAVTGNGHDYVAQASGLITETFGSFPSVTGVKSERSVGVAAFGGGGILGPNEYTLQINTNYTGTTSVCAGHSGCTVWQQFIYSPDYVTKGQAAVFMQYWLIGWGSSRCPKPFASAGAGSGDCYTNSSYVTAPDMPITDLGELTISGTVVAGGNDTVTFNNGSEAYSVSGSDSMLDISAVWTQSEFNVVGNAGGSRADFNRGSSITVKSALTDGSTAAPACVANEGSTGETNNLTLSKTCSTVSGATPYIEFTEKN